MAKRVRVTMSFFLSEIRRIADDLNAAGTRWCLVGGLGASIYAEPRTTKDIDVVVAIDSEQAMDQLKGFLASKGYSSPSILMHTQPTRRMGWRVLLASPRCGDVPLDILSNACGIEHQITQHAVKLEVLPGVWLPVAALGHLIAMKVLSQHDVSRLQDRVDLMALLRVAQPQDIEFAKVALLEIAQAGYSSGRNLVEELEKTIVYP
jgi:predicted nucleotidyltransferase